MAVLRHVLCAETCPVQEQFHAGGVAVGPDINRLAFFAGPVPVRQDMDNRLVAPDGLVIVIVVFGEAALVHDAEVGIDAGPAKGRRLAFVIKAGPDKAAGDKGPVGDGLPGIFRRLRPGRRIDIIGADIAFCLVALVAIPFIRGINAARADRAAGLAAVKRHAPGGPCGTSHMRRDCS